MSKFNNSKTKFYRKKEKNRLKKEKIKRLEIENERNMMLSQSNLDERKNL